MGQEAACGALLHNLRRDKIASSYLFTGPEGSGKTTTANLFAKALLCSETSGEGATPCCKCKSCLMFDSGSHPDFFSISPDGTMIKIDQIRELISSLSLKSYFGGRKVAVVHEADTMKGPPANAFLKTLEEPPANTVLILVTANPSALLPTVVSRCRATPFVPMEPSKLAGLLEKRLGLSGEEALRAAILAEGCFGRAMGGGMDEIKALDDEAIRLMSQIADMPVDAVVGFAEGWKKDRRKELPILLERMAEILRRSQTGKYAQSSDIITHDMDGFVGVPGDRAVECFDMLMEAAPATRFNPNVQLFLEALIFNMQSVLQKGHRIGTKRS